MLPLGLYPAPQLVMLANVATVTAEGGGTIVSTVTAEGGGVCSEGGGAKEMMELQTVGGTFSDDDEDDNIIRYSFDDRSQREVCIVEYPESPAFRQVMGGQEEEIDTQEEEKDRQEVEKEVQDLTPSTKLHTSPTNGAQTLEKKSKKKPFHCKPCNFQAQNEAQFVDHLQTHAISKMLVVKKVEGRSHKGKEAGQGRVDQEPSNQNAAGAEIKGLIRCERCGYNTNRYDHYISHLKHHSRDQDHRVFKCTLCPYTTVSQYHWRKHLRNHFPSKLHTCSQCSYFSDRKSNYIQHIRTHTGVRPFQCPYCDYSSSQKTHLTRHMRTHSGERPFKCESCNYLAANQHEVTRHARQVHNGPKPLACPYCEYKTADRSNFKKHVELHLNPRQFLCPLCKYAASKKCNLQYHLKSRHAGCDVSLDVSKVKLRVKKPEWDSNEERDERNTDSDHAEAGFVDLNEDLEEESSLKDASPINLSIKKGKEPESPEKTAKKSPEMEAKVVRDKVEKEKKLKQRKMDVSVKADEKLALKKRKKVDKMMGKQFDQEVKDLEKGQDKLPMEEGKTGAKGSARKDKRTKKLVFEKAGKKDRTVKRKLSEVLDLSRKMEHPSKSRKLKETIEEKNVEERKEVKTKLKKNKNSNKKGPQSQTVVKEDLRQMKRAESLVEEVSEIKESIYKIQKQAHKSTVLNGPKNGQGLDKEAAKNVAETANENEAKKPVVPEDSATKAPPNKLGKSPIKSTQISENVSKVSPNKVSEKVDPLLEKSSKKQSKKVENWAGKITQEKMEVEAEKVANKLPKKEEKNPNKAAKKTGLLASEPAKDKESVPKKVPKERPNGEVQPENPLENLEKETNVPLKDKESPVEKSPQMETASPSEDSSAPVFLKPLPRPPLFLPRQTSTKSVEPEDDEGIHEAGSDVSDSASECSDDSGLKMNTDPETPPIEALTPTDEIPMPTALKSHLCIFCDRTFPFKTEYQRHLNRHLVNVYFMDPSKAPK